MDNFHNTLMEKRAKIIINQSKSFLYSNTDISTKYNNNKTITKHYYKPNNNEPYHNHHNIHSQDKQ